MQTLADSRGDGAGKSLASAETIGNIHALLPSLQLSTVKLLETAKLLQVVIFVIVVVEVEVAHFVEAARELAPGALPLCVTGLPTGSPQALPRPHVEASHLSRVGTLHMLRPRRDGLGFGVGAVGGVLSEAEQVSTFHAVPVAVRDTIETDAMSMIGSIAAIAQEQDIFPLGRVAYGTRVGFLFLLRGVVAKPSLDVELGDLLLVLDTICG